MNAIGGKEPRRIRPCLKRLRACLLAGSLAVLSTGHADVRNPSRCEPYSPAMSEETRFDTARCLLNAGRVEALTAIVEDLGSQLHSQSNHSVFAAITDAAANFRFNSGERDAALDLLNLAVEHIASSGEPSAAASLLNTAGRFYVSAGAHMNALASFSDAARVAAPASHSLRATALLNRARALMAVLPQRELPLKAIEQEIAGIGDARLRARHLILLGDLKERSGARDLQGAIRAYEQALALLEGYGDSEERAYALGYRARVSYDRSELTDARRDTQNALLIAQRTSSSSVYLWEWQLARIELAEGRQKKALTLYRAAADSLDSVRSSFWSSDAADFERLARPLYRELVALLIGKPNQPSTEATLEEATTVLDRAILAEVENYFRDECAEAVSTGLALDAIDKDVALLYPVVFDDRIELLLATSSGIERTTSEVGADSLDSSITQLRLAIQFLAPVSETQMHAQRLYDWLISPLAETLKQHNTLVVVPDARLRALPFGALHDGDAYLVESLAVSIAPGLRLLDAKPSARELRVLASGISDARLGFDALPFVRVELERINDLLPTTVNLNEEFDEASLLATIADRQHNVLHMATHAEIGSQPGGSFLVMHDDLLLMNRLEEVASARRFLGDPLELLVLSACETAAGDDRAHLGMAGMAVQAGARSAVASLWQLSDEATASLMEALYAALTLDRPIAEALQQAQLSMLETERFAHPAFWSGFVLVGNWR